MPRDRSGGVARCPRPGQSAAGECGNSNGCDDSERLGVQQPAIVFGAAVLREQTGRALAGCWDQAEMLNDDCLGRTLDWLYAHDPTKLFAGIASRARQIFGISAHQVHVDTTSFSVSGAYSSAGERVQEPGKRRGQEAETALIAITYGYSRDHREDLKQWMLALATTHDGDVPLFLQPLDGNSSDKVSLLAAVMAIQEQLREANAEPSVYVADNGIYSESNMRQLNEAGVKWISRVSGDLHGGENGAARRQSGLATIRGWQHPVV